MPSSIRLSQSLLGLLFLSTALVNAQSTEKIIPFSTLPACAATCDELNAANDVCVPPAVAVADAATYTECVCNSPRLAGVYADANAVCAQFCPEQADRDTIRNTYINLCPNQAAAAGVTGTQDGTTTNPEGTVSSDLPPNEFNGSDDNDDWLANHYQWVIMVVILVVAAIVGIVVGIWFKRRHSRKKNAARQNVGATESGTAHADRTSTSLPPGTAGTGAPARQSMSQTSLPGGMMGMNSGVAPPRSRGLVSSRSRSSTVNSSSGPITMGPHHTSTTNIPAVPPISPVYQQGDYPDRTYSPAANRPYSGADSSARNSAALHPPVRTGSAGSPSPVSAIDERSGGYDGAGAQRIREMRSRENVENISRTGTPDSVTSGGRRISKKISKRSSTPKNAS